MQYVGKRYVDIENTGQLDAFLNVRMQGSYAASSTLDVVFNADNLINSTIILWNGYRQRGIFVSGGVSWRF
jgi:outer membrane cobalamin receptor